MKCMNYEEPRQRLLCSRTAMRVYRDVFRVAVAGIVSATGDLVRKCLSESTSTNTAFCECAGSTHHGVNSTSFWR